MSEEVKTIEPKRGPGPPKGNTNARKHGLHSAKAVLSEWGQRAIDGRSALGRALAEWRSQIVTDLGGSQALSAQQHAVLDVVVRTKVLLDGVDNFILSQKTIVLKRKKQLIPVVRERVALADSFVKHLTILGLERKAADVPTLSAYIASKRAPDATSHEDDRAANEG